MNIYEAVVYLILGVCAVLALIGVYMILRNPLEILYSILRFMRADWKFAIIFFPIWFPSKLLDDAYNLGIFTPDEELNDDIVYPVHQDHVIDTNNYTLIILLQKVSIDWLQEELYSYLDTVDESDVAGFHYFETEEEVALIFPTMPNLCLYAFTIQWFSESSTNAAPYPLGLAIHKNDPDCSFYTQQDNSDQHINSLIGSLRSGTRFSYYLLCDEAKYNTLGVNNDIKHELPFDWNKIGATFNPESIASNSKPLD